MLIAVVLVLQSDDWKLELLPEGAVGRNWDTWPVIGPTINIGECGDEGVTDLIRPAVLMEAKAAFETIYTHASAAERRRIERATEDLYGGMEELRKMQSMILQWYHWAVRSEPFSDLRLIFGEAVLGHEHGEAEYGVPEWVEGHRVNVVS